jgi:hypothetical protein
MFLVDVVTQGVSARTGRRVRDLIVEISSTGEGVILRGRADSFHVKQLAQQGAREVLPNAHLENAIEVE